MAQRVVWRFASSRALFPAIATTATAGTALFQWKSNDQETKQDSKTSFGTTTNKHNYLWWCSSSSSAVTQCDEGPEAQANYVPYGSDSIEGMQADAKGDFHGLFPQRQLWQPKVDYPLWDSDWDDRRPTSTGDEEEDLRRMRRLRAKGITRHIILVRHGQYDETHKEDERRTLTPLGRLQAEMTGKRLAEMMRGAENPEGNGQVFSPCSIKVLRSSNMTRAKETADIIAKQLEGVEVAPPEPLLNEGRPCHHIPGARASKKIIAATDEHHPRIEEAFRKFFFRSEAHRQDDDEASSQPQEAPSSAENKHEFEIIVCHANVIRYCACRALQIPPETWLRFCPMNCSLTYLTIRPTGNVSCRMLGDVGHLPYSHTTFSKHLGFNW